jgi:hypothetical protein
MGIWDNTARNVSCAEKTFTSVGTREVRDTHAVGTKEIPRLNLKNSLNSRRNFRAPVSIEEKVGLNGVQGRDGLDSSTVADAKTTTIKEVPLDQSDVKVGFSCYQRDVEVISDPTVETKNGVDELAERHPPVSLEKNVNLSGTQRVYGLDDSFISKVSTTDSTPERITTDEMSSTRAEESPTEKDVISDLFEKTEKEEGACTEEGDADTLAAVAKEIPMADAESTKIEDSAREADVANDSSTETSPRKHRTTDADKDPSLLPLDATDDEKAKRFYNAAAMLEEDEDAKFSDGSIWTEKACLCTALTLNPNFGSAYYNLGVCLGEDEQVSLFGFDDWNNKKLWIRAIDCDPDSRCEWWTLAENLEDGATVHFDHDGRSPWERHRLLMRCITFAKDEKITMGRTEECSLQDVYLRAIEADPTFAYAYARLGKSLQPGQRVTLPDGAEVTADELLAKAVAMNPYSLENFSKLDTPLEAVGEEDEEEEEFD